MTKGGYIKRESIKRVLYYIFSSDMTAGIGMAIYLARHPCLSLGYSIAMLLEGKRANNKSVQQAPSNEGGQHCSAAGSTAACRRDCSFLQGTLTPRC
jgi:hypothetical protein